jgi:hypothetical protein
MARRGSISGAPAPSGCRCQGLPWTPEFMAAYEAAIEGNAPRIEIGVSRTKPGIINALVVSYFNSMAFQSLAPETKRTRRNILERFRAEHGDKRAALGSRSRTCSRLRYSGPKMARGEARTENHARRDARVRRSRPLDLLLGLSVLPLDRYQRGQMAGSGPLIRS